MVTYRERVADTLLEDYLSYSGGVLVEGVRACGKTLTARNHCVSEVDVDTAAGGVAAALAVDPALLLQGPTPRLIDEWQLAPDLWNIARRAIDDRGLPGQFILTGSSVPPDDAMRHSGAHRISKIRMRPMTLHEQGKGLGSVSLRALFEGRMPSSSLDTGGSVSDAIDDLVHGGWPGDLSLTTVQAAQHMSDYLEDVVTVDVDRLDGEPRRDPIRMRALLRSLARHVGTEATYTTIAADVAGVSMSAETVVSYIGTLRRLFMVEEQEAWAPHVRSKYAVRTSSKWHFVDPALAAAVSGVGVNRLMSDLETAGQWFESQVVQHLRTFAQPLRGEIFHYRDKAGREADVVVTLPNGRWALCEVKLGERQIPTAQDSLRATLDNLDISRMGEPAFVAIITASGPTMPLLDNMLTFPLRALCP